jgi:hypothetical protein
MLELGSSCYRYYLHFWVTRPSILIENSSWNWCPQNFGIVWKNILEKGEQSLTIQEASLKFSGRVYCVFKK